MAEGQEIQSHGTYQLYTARHGQLIKHQHEEGHLHPELRQVLEEAVRQQTQAGGAKIRIHRIERLLLRQSARMAVEERAEKVSPKAPGSFWNPETDHFGTRIILEHRGEENYPGLQSDTSFADHFGTHILR